MFEMFLHNISQNNQRVSEWSHEEASSMLFNDMLDKYSDKIIIKKESCESKFINSLI
jgi:hypothetical protein